jgi:peptide deformylase
VADLQSYLPFSWATRCCARPCQEIRDTSAQELRQLAGDLSDTLAGWVARTGYGRGIAAPQIGAPVRVIYLTTGSAQTLVNPVITAHSASTWEVWDACLSFSVEIFCKVRRFTGVDVAYESPDGRRHSLRADGELGELLQHEIDHLDGVLAVDRMTSIAALCMRSEFERRYRGESPYRP